MRQAYQIFDIKDPQVQQIVKNELELLDKKEDLNPCDVMILYILFEIDIKYLAKVWMV